MLAVAYMLEALPKSHCAGHGGAAGSNLGIKHPQRRQHIHSCRENGKSRVSSTVCAFACSTQLVLAHSQTAARTVKLGGPAVGLQKMAVATKCFKCLPRARLKLTSLALPCTPHGQQPQNSPRISSILAPSSSGSGMVNTAWRRAAMQCWTKLTGRRRQHVQDLAKAWTVAHHCKTCVNAVPPASRRVG